MSRIGRTITLVTSAFLLSTLCRAQSTGTSSRDTSRGDSAAKARVDSASATPADVGFLPDWRVAAARGLSLTLGYTPYLTSFSASKRGHRTITLDVLYDVTPWLGLGLRIGTGEEQLDSGRVAPYSGSFSFGSGSVVANIHPFESSVLRPYLLVDGGLCTALGPIGGYNGTELGAALGEELNVVRHFTISAAITYRHRFYAQRLDFGRSAPMDTPLDESVLGITAAASLYFDLHP